MPARKNWTITATKMIQADTAYVHRMARANMMLCHRSAPRRAPSTSSGRATRVGSHTASRSDAFVSWWTEATSLRQPAHEQEACPLPLTQRHAVMSVQLVTLLLLQGALVPGAPLRPGERVFGGCSAAVHPLQACIVCLLGLSRLILESHWS